MIYDTGNPFDDMFDEDVHEHTTHEHTKEEIETHEVEETPTITEKTDIKKYSNLIAYGVIGVVGLLILKRYM